MARANAAQTFQRFNPSVLKNLNFCFVHMDDVLVEYSSEPEQFDHLECIFQRLFEARLMLNVEKCKFSQKQGKFLGHRITPVGIQPDVGKVEAIQNFSLSTTAKDLRRFLDMLNFYCRFLPNATHYQTILNTYLCRPKTKNSRQVEWSRNAVFWHFFGQVHR